MDTANAFIGKLDPPSDAEVIAALGPVTLLWNELVDWMAKEVGAEFHEWKSYSPKAGWSLALKAKKRTIVWLSPCKKSFRVVFILGDKAVEAARHSHLPSEISDLIDEAPRFPEGTGIRLQVRKAGDLSSIRKLAQIKAAH